MVSFYLKYFWLSTRFYVENLHKYLMRLFYHFFPFGKRPVYKIPARNVVDWVGDLLCYLADLLLVSYCLQLLSLIVKPRQRFLEQEEISLAREIFADKVKYEYVTIHPHMSNYLRKLALAYVSGNAINFQKSITKRVFIHEMVHVWQYQRFGIVYAWRALKAQQETATYDYGGLEALYVSFTEGKGFYEFNFEQQAQIIEDYFSLQYNYREYLHPMNDAIYAGYLNKMLDESDLM